MAASGRVAQQALGQRKDQFPDGGLIIHCGQNARAFRVIGSDELLRCLAHFVAHIVEEDDVAHGKR